MYITPVRRIALRLGSVLVIVLGLWSLLRRSAELDLSGFTEGERFAAVSPQGYRPGGRPMKRTWYLYPEHPWAASVAAFGARIEAQGFVRDLSGRGSRWRDPTWRRGGKTVAIHLRRYPRTDRMVTATITLERPATLGDVALDGSERWVERWRRTFRRPRAVGSP